MKYERPEMELLTFETQDVVRTSDVDMETPEGPW